MADTLDVLHALAFVARRTGKRSMPATEWAHVLSLGLGWMTPGEARAFVAGAEGVLVPDGDNLRLRVDPASVEVPRTFRPDPLARPGPSKKDAGEAPDGFLAWVDRVAESTGGDRGQALGRVTAMQDRMGGLLDADAAVLRVARQVGLDVREAAITADR